MTPTLYQYRIWWLSHGEWKLFDEEWRNGRAPNGANQEFVRVEERELFERSADMKDKLTWTGAGQHSLQYHGRQIGFIQKWKADDQWQVHFMGDFAKVETEAYAREALMSSAIAWLEG